jgi:FMN phosphatase YigB (HAD superfamily)
MSRPKAVIFDLGGVLITSPLKAIEEYETENDIPHGYLNYAMLLPSTTSLIVALPHNRMLGPSWKQELYKLMRRFTHDGMLI